MKHDRSLICSLCASSLRVSLDGSCSLCQPETLGKLVAYVTEMPTPADSEARRYKYPYVASEVLSCDLTQLRDAVFAAPSLIVQLLALLKQPPPLPPVLAGYVGKIITSLQKQGPEQFKKFFEDEMPTEDLLPQLMVHIGSDSILQLLINLCIGEPPVAEPGGPAVLATPRDELADQSWLPHSLLIPAALDALGGGTAGDTAEATANASALLCALLAASTEPPLCLEEGDAGVLRCAALVRVCLGDEVGEPPNLAALEVVLQLLTKLREAPPPPPGAAPTTSPVLSSLLDAVEVDIERFFAALAAASPLPDRIARFLPADGAAYRPRGQQRCKLLLLLEECLKSERPALVQPLVELGLFDIVTDLLLLPHTCNALHMRASAILEWAIAVGTPSVAPSVHSALLKDAKLGDRLLELVYEYAPDRQPMETA